MKKKKKNQERRRIKQNGKKIKGKSKERTMKKKQ
jgi:hypothetical protein